MPSPAQIHFDHVACGVRRVSEIAPLVELELGGEPFRGGPGAGFRGGQWAFGGGGRLELIEPDGEPGGFLHRFLDKGGPAIHHLTFKVPDIYAARDRATSLGYEVVGFRDDVPAWQECFLHPKQVGGIVVQLACSKPGVEEDDWIPFARVTSGAPKQVATLRGLRLASRDEDRMRRCWIDLLGATVAGSARDANRATTTYRWHDSPLTLEVLVDPRADVEGPLGLRFAFDGEAPPALEGVLGAKLLRD
jgi:hypothetical protein